MHSDSMAKTALLSSVVTIMIVGAVATIFRSEFAAWMLQGAQLTPSGMSSSEIESYESTLTGAIADANPAVVSVVVTKDVPVYERYYESYDWFGGLVIPRTRQQGTEEREVGGGSGFIVGPDGLIVTNRHVVDDRDARYSVLLNDATAYDVEVLARDEQLDIAILQLSEPPTEPLPFLRFGDSESLVLGQTVIAIGNALAEFRNSVSVGVVSGLSRSIVASDAMGRSEQLNQVIQTDAAINPGNSGGPLLNLDGEVVGVNVATSRGADNIGFALPGHIVAAVVDSVREHGEIVRPYLGVRYMMLTERAAEVYNLPFSYGAWVTAGEGTGLAAVDPDSPAATAGITEGSIILAVDDEELREQDLATVLRSKEVGETIMLRVHQSGSEELVSVVLEKRL